MGWLHAGGCYGRRAKVVSLAGEVGVGRARRDASGVANQCSETRTSVSQLERGERLQRFQRDFRHATQTGSTDGNDTA